MERFAMKRHWKFTLVGLIALITSTLFSPLAYARTNSSCPVAWQFVSAPDIGDGAGLVGIDGVAENDVWAVGSYSNGSFDQTLIEHWDGAQWNVVPSPNAAAQSNRLGAVVALATNDAWALGATDESSFLVRWNGTAWNFAPTPQGVSVYFDSIDGTASDNVWIGGIVVEKPYAARWDGTQWLEMTPPTLLATARIQRIITIASNQVYVLAVAYDETTQPYPVSRTYFVLRWDGADWTTFGEFTSYRGVHGSWPSINDLAVIAANDIWLVGDDFEYVLGSSFTIRRWDGTTWQDLPSPPYTGRQAFLTAIAAKSSVEAWVVGSHEREWFGARVPLLSQWNGTAWNTLSPFALEIHSGLRELALVGDTIWLVGHQGDNALIVQGKGCAELPAPPALTTPKKQATLKKSKPILRWQDSPTSLYAEVEIQDDIGSSLLLASARDGIYKSEYAFERGHTYLWRARSCNAAGCGEWSKTRKFSIREK